MQAPTSDCLPPTATHTTIETLKDVAMRAGEVNSAVAVKSMPAIPAKAALRQNSIRAADLTGLLKTLQFDNSRADLAKVAYPRVADQQNFDQVYSTFEFEASVREVQDAVAMR